MAKDVVVEMLAIESTAYGRLGSSSEAERSLSRGEQLCTPALEWTCGSLIRSQGVLALERGQLALARKFFESSLSFARSHNDKFLEATALLNLGVASLQEEHFDEAVDWADAALKSSSAIDAGSIATKAQENRGWAYYNLGDSQRSLDLSEQAEKRAVELSNVIDQMSCLNNIGYVYAELHDLTGAKQSYAESLDIAQRIRFGRHIYNSLRALALVSVESSDLAEASKYSDEAIRIAQSDKNRLNELYPLLVKGLIAARSSESAEAERIFHEVDRDPSANPSLRWRSEHALARLYEDESRTNDADREYRTALATFESARSSLQRNDSKLPFSNNASRIYDDYIHFLVTYGKTDEALRWADNSRARTLAEGLGMLTKGAASGPPPLNPRQVSQHAQATILFYWLGEKQSYLWAITPQKIGSFPLPPGKEIDAAVLRYRKSLGGPQDVLSSSDEDGRWLWRTLIAPAQAGIKSGINIKKDAKVLIIPDGSLNNLNFETLLAPDEASPDNKQHFWIEDVTIANASSLRVVSGARAAARDGASPVSTANESESAGKDKRRLLLIGNGISPSNKYPELPKAAAQMESVARHFPSAAEKILAREQATPAAYLASSPEQYSTIHFVAHGTASRLSPLDSAIVLSKSAASSNADDSFKLYARDIIAHPLHADLVTISACYGAGERAYSGEGLVGLSWAFLRAGAHNVVAALWEATDASTEQLMDRFYDELAKGASPDAALRAAKLSLLRSSGFHNPFYWAPFQLYAGS
jgi:CHAT domain-containing protein/tetratricopeptide (TPR) repeat protein